MEHKYHKCNDNECRICNGGLADCEVCNGAEGSLTTECCGRPLSSREQERIYKGFLDYKDGQWIGQESRIYSVYLHDPSGEYFVDLTDEGDESYPLGVERIEDNLTYDQAQEKMGQLKEKMRKEGRNVTVYLNEPLFYDWKYVGERFKSAIIVALESQSVIVQNTQYLTVKQLKEYKKLTQDNMKRIEKAYEEMMGEYREMYSKTIDHIKNGKKPVYYKGKQSDMDDLPFNDPDDLPF
jgi:hypothetical protein